MKNIMTLIVLISSLFTSVFCMDRQRLILKSESKTENGSVWICYYREQILSQGNLLCDCCKKCVSGIEKGQEDSKSYVQTYGPSGNTTYLSDNLRYTYNDLERAYEEQITDKS